MKNRFRIHVERTAMYWVMAERSHGVFTRQLYLGNNLDLDRIYADYTDEVSPAERPKRLDRVNQSADVAGDFARVGPGQA